MTSREKQFSRIFCRHKPGLTLIFEPKTFPLLIDGVKTRYIPDFYCQETKIYYEVVGTRQAFHSAKYKIKAFMDQYPGLLLDIVDQHARAYQFKSLDYRSGLAFPKSRKPTKQKRKIQNQPQDRYRKDQPEIQTHVILSRETLGLPNALSPTVIQSLTETDSS